MSDCLQPHGLNQARPPCPSPFSGFCPSSCPLNRWCHLTISSSIAFFSCPQFFLASGSFPVTWLFTSGRQTIGVLASALDTRMSIQGWFPLGLTGLISLLSKGLSRVFSTTLWKHHFFGTQPSLFIYFFTFFMVQLSYSHMITGKTTTLTIKDFVGNMMSLLFNTLSRFAIIFLLRRKCLLISWLQSPSALILESPKKKFVTASTFTPSICHEVMGPDDTIIVCLLVVVVVV